MALKQPAFLIDRILPAQEVHLLGGPTGAGKTRWLLHMLKDWEKGLPVLGFDSHPVPWCYVAADRSMLSVERTLLGIGLTLDDLHVIPAWGENKLIFSQILDRIYASKAKLAVIEGFQSFAEGKDRKDVKDLLNRTQTHADKSGLTFIGVCESPKMKPHERYENPRQRISGVASWGHFSDTIMLIEPANPKDPSDPARRLIVCPRNSAGITCVGGFLPDGRVEFDRESIDEQIVR